MEKDNLQEPPKQSIFKNFKIFHFLSYCVTFLFYGTVITALGPLIPFLASRDQRNQTEYSFLFVTKAFGFLIAGFLVKLIARVLSLHMIIFISAMVLGGFSIGFCFIQTLYGEGIMMFFLSIGSGCMEVSVNMAILQISSTRNSQILMQVSGGVFGVGGLIGPMFVYIFKLNSYLAIGLNVLSSSIGYICLKSPQIKDHQNYGTITEQNIRRQANSRQTRVSASQSSQNQQKLEEVPRNIEFRICTLLFLYIGVEIAFGGWISSYAVLQNISTKQQATGYSSIFWLCITIFRFIFAFIPFKISQKIIALGVMLFISTIISTITSATGYYFVTAIFSSVAFGMFLSPIFPFLVTIPSEFNMQFTIDQRANLMIFASFGEALISPFIGYLMNITVPNTLFYSIAIVSLFYLALLFNTVFEMKKIVVFKQQSLSIEKSPQKKEVEVISQNSVLTAKISENSDKKSPLQIEIGNLIDQKDL